jgi:hypothetical protein
MNSWKHDADDETETESSGDSEFARQALCSFFPLKKEHLSALRRSWEDGDCRDGGGQLRVGDGSPPFLRSAPWGRAGSTEQRMQSFATEAHAFCS